MKRSNTGPYYSHTDILLVELELVQTRIAKTFRSFINFHTHMHRHVMLPKDIAEKLPKDRLLTETEWRNLGVQQSRGWVHYMMHKPEPHIMLFRRLHSESNAPIPTSE